MNERQIPDSCVPIVWRWNPATGVTHDDPITIEAVDQRGGGELYAVRLSNEVLNVATLEFEYEPMPSHRGDDHAQRYRFASLEDAVAALRRLDASGGTSND